MFIAGAVVVGGIIVAHDDHSRYSDHSRHSRYNEYGDSQLRNEINNLQNSVNNKESEIGNLRRRMNDNFNSQISALKQEKNYSALSGDADNILANVKSEMKREIETAIQEDQRELENINKMIAKINELELQATGVPAEKEDEVTGR